MNRLRAAAVVLLAIACASIGHAQEGRPTPPALSGELMFFVQTPPLAGDPPGMVRALRTTEAKVGDSHPLKFFVSGAGRREDGGVDLTYDLRFLDPAGNVAAGLDDHGLRPDAAPDGATFQNTEVPFIIFEPSDPAGVYRAEATIHDHVTGKDLTLTAQIELKK